jgi:hypothetical protein
MPSAPQDHPSVSGAWTRIRAGFLAALTYLIVVWTIYFVGYQTWTMPDQVGSDNIASRIVWSALFALMPTLAIGIFFTAPAGRRFVRSWPALVMAGLVVAAFGLATYDRLSAANDPEAMAPLPGALMFVAFALLGPVALAVHLEGRDEHRARQ